MNGAIQTFVPLATPVKAFQLPDGNWIVLNGDVTEWKQMTDIDFRAAYQPQ